jgi:hypothetical protein
MLAARVVPCLLALVAALAVPAQAQDTPRLFVLGDSLGYQTEEYLPKLLSDWRVRQNIDFGRRTRDAVRALRRRSRLPAVVHVSVGTSDEPRPRPFRRNVRRIMRIVGRERCVVWANIWRPAPPGEAGWTRLNRVLAKEAGRRPNLIVVDWHSMVKANQDWLVYDDVHVFREGAVARARAVASAVRSCGEQVAESG